MENRVGANADDDHHQRDGKDPMKPGKEGIRFSTDPDVDSPSPFDQYPHGGEEERKKERENETIPADDLAIPRDEQEVTAEEGKQG
jgi:hypothetical protein